MDGGLHVDHVAHWNALGDADNDPDAGVRRFQNAVGGKPAGT